MLIDGSNTFFYGETSLDGVLDLVSRSKKSVQFPEHNAGTLVAEGFLDDTVRYTVEDVCHVLVFTSAHPFERSMCVPSATFL